jgi:hypothetical protein
MYHKLFELSVAPCTSGVQCGELEYAFQLERIYRAVNMFYAPSFL